MIKSLKRAHSDRQLRRLLIFLTLWLNACSAAENKVVSLFSPSPHPQSPTASQKESIAGKSLSAGEALSRGLAAITPPGAPLKDIYYEFDSILLLADAQEILKSNAEWMKANPKTRVEVEGHCDDVGSAEYNLALGAKRAQTAKEFLVEQGISPERLVTISYGKEAPACIDPTEDCRVKNRRARFVIFSELPMS